MEVSDFSNVKSSYSAPPCNSQHRHADADGGGTVLSTKTPLFMDRNRKTLYAPAYASPTNAKVATLILTDGGKTERRAEKKAARVEPVVNM